MRFPFGSKSDENLSHYFETGYHSDELEQATAKWNKLEIVFNY